LDYLTSIVVLTSWYIGRVITYKSHIIEYGTLWATRCFGLDAIIADVVFTAIFRVNVQLVVTVGNSELRLGFISGAGEAIGENLSSLFAANTESFGCPVTDTTELIKIESFMALAHIGDTVHTLIVFLAVGGVLMFKATILAGALNTRWLSLLLNFSFGTVDNDFIVALLNAGS